MPPRGWSVSYVQRHLGTDRLPKGDVIQFLQKKAKVSHICRHLLAASFRVSSFILTALMQSQVIRSQLGGGIWFPVVSSWPFPVTFLPCLSTTPSWPSSISPPFPCLPFQLTTLPPALPLSLPPVKLATQMEAAGECKEHQEEQELSSAHCSLQGMYVPWRLLV